MFKHNILLFIRNIKKHKSTFLINIIGLGVGIASFLVLALYIYNDHTYNHFHKNIANIYRVGDGESMQTKGLVLQEMMEDIPEIENGTRIFDWDEYRLSHNETAFPENVLYVDQGFFSVFTFPFIEGFEKEILKEKYGAVISKPFAEKYFGTTSAVGKQFQVGFGDIYLTVKGVVDIPKNSSVVFNIVTSYETGEEISPWIKEVHDWYNQFSITYVQLKKGTTPIDIQNKLQNLVTENYLPVGKNKTQLNLVPFKEYHSKEESNQTLIIILGLIALGILGIAIVNFINLTITNSFVRTKEIGIKKVHGATKKHLIKQIMIESFFVGFVALLLGIVLMTTFLLPAFNVLFETSLSIDLTHTKFLTILMFGIWLTVGLISSLVPSFFWTKGKLVDILHGKFSSYKKASFSKYSSIVIQFVIAIFLISGTLLIRKQINYMLQKDTKFDSENVIVAQTDVWQFKNMERASQNLELIYKELEASPYIASVSFTGSIPGDYDENYNTFFPEDQSSLTNISLRKSYVGKNYFKTMGIHVLDGSGFDQDFASLEGTVILNKMAMDQLGYTNVDGQIIRESSASGQPYRIIGVIDDFSYQGAQREMQPLAHFFSHQEAFTNWDYLIVKAKKGASLQAIKLLNDKWKEMLPEASLTHFFSDNMLNKYYKEYERVNTLISWFSILAIILSCIGLFALSSYSMARRTKEIGIRKVNGATIAEIIQLLNKDFIKWVGVAFFIAIPISWYAMNIWLESFAYKTSLSWWIFVLAGIIVLMIALLTITWQSFKAALCNPVEALKEE